MRITNVLLAVCSSPRLIVLKDVKWQGSPFREYADCVVLKSICQDQWVLWISELKISFISKTADKTLLGPILKTDVDSTQPERQHGRPRTKPSFQRYKPCKVSPFA